MRVQVNLRHLEKKTVRLEGAVAARDLEVDQFDELVRAPEPIRYDLEVERNGDTLLVRGSLQTQLACECVRCLRPFQYSLTLDPYQAEVPLEGEEKPPVDGDLVDLTPRLREDIVLSFPQHPLCEAGCERLPNLSPGRPLDSSAESSAPVGKSAWDALDKLKLK